SRGPHLDAFRPGRAGLSGPRARLRHRDRHGQRRGGMERGHEGSGVATCGDPRRREGGQMMSKALIVPGLPQVLLAPEQSPGWNRLYAAYEEARKEIEKSDADFILYYSTQWLSVLGYTFQADPEPEWVHVDHNFHDLGSMPYKFRI